MRGPPQTVALAKVYPHLRASQHIAGSALAATAGGDMGKHGEISGRSSRLENLCSLHLARKVPLMLLCTGDSAEMHQDRGRGST